MFDQLSGAFSVLPMSYADPLFSQIFQGNHRKAMKLLALALQQQPPEKLTSRLGSMFENNLGCLHLMLAKPNLGVFYFSQVQWWYKIRFHLNTIWIPDFLVPGTQKVLCLPRQVIRWKNPISRLVFKWHLCGKDIASNIAKKVGISNAHLAIRWQSYKLLSSAMTFIACSSLAHFNAGVCKKCNIVSPRGHYKIVWCGSNKVSCVHTMNRSISFTLSKHWTI